MGQLLTNQGGPGSAAPLGMRQFHESIRGLLPLEQEFPRCLQQELTPHQPCGAGAPRPPPQQQLLPHTRGLACICCQSPTGISFLGIIFILLSGLSWDDVKYVWQIHSPHHISCVELLGLRQQLPCLQLVYLRRLPICLGSCCNLEIQLSSPLPCPFFRDRITNPCAALIKKESGSHFPSPSFSLQGILGLCLTCCSPASESGGVQASPSSANLISRLLQKFLSITPPRDLTSHV